MIGCMLAGKEFVKHFLQARKGIMIFVPQGVLKSIWGWGNPSRLLGVLDCLGNQRERIRVPSHKRFCLCQYFILRILLLSEKLQSLGWILSPHFRGTLLKVQGQWERGEDASPKPGNTITGTKSQPLEVWYCVTSCPAIIDLLIPIETPASICVGCLCALSRGSDNSSNASYCSWGRAATETCGTWSPWHKVLQKF